MSKCALTTFDNPFNPFDDFVKWNLFDVENKYNTCTYLARIANTSDMLSELENENEVERAIDEIIKYDARNVYKKIYKDEDQKIDT